VVDRCCDRLGMIRAFNLEVHVGTDGRLGVTFDRVSRVNGMFILNKLVKKTDFSLLRIIIPLRMPKLDQAESATY
jgi:hypothetical protein